jgi:hypothetical protein
MEKKIAFSNEMGSFSLLWSKIAENRSRLLTDSQNDTILMGDVSQ